MATTFERLRGAQIRCCVQSGPLGRLAMFCAFELDEQVQFSKLGDRRVVFNPAYLETLTRDVLDRKLMRHVLHLGLRHHSRQGERVPLRWAAATGELAHVLVAPPSPAFQWVKQAQVFCAEDMVPRRPSVLTPGPRLPPWTGDVAPEASDAYWASILRDLADWPPHGWRARNVDWMDWSLERERALDVPLPEPTFNPARDLERITDHDATLFLPEALDVRLRWLSTLVGKLESVAQAHGLMHLVAARAEPLWLQFLIAKLMPVVRQRAWRGEFISLHMKDALVKEKMQQIDRLFSAMQS